MRRRPVLVGILVTVGVPAVVGLGWGGWRLWRRERDPMGVAGGVRLLYRVDAPRSRTAPAPNQPGVPQRTADAVRERIKPYNRHAIVQAQRDELEVLIPAIGGPPPMDQFKLLIARSGRLEFKVVDDGSDYMKTIAVELHRNPFEGVTIQPESWGDPAGGRDHEDLFLVGAQAEQLVAALSALVRVHPLPEDHDILLEKRASDWRTYYVFSTAHLDNADVREAEVNWAMDKAGDPEVSIELTSAGGEKFSALTGRSVGRKVAIVLEDRVVTAPVINGRIPGFRVRVTLGADYNPYERAQAAKDLVAVLRQQALPAPMVLVSEETVSPRD